MSRSHEEYMQLALLEAVKGAGCVNPNPLVGAVVVKDGSIIGQGYHEAYSKPHAERNALANCSSSPKGATIYVTLEPCSHHGKTPPCTEALIENGIATVIMGVRDPNPLVAGKGVEQLKAAGIEVIEGVCEAECLALNRVFFHFIKTGLPYVVMKYGMTMDGKIATYTGASRWITGEAARQKVHEDRNLYTAIMAGVGTVLADDPLLTCRIANGRNPLRIICDTHLRTPLTSQLVSTASEVATLIATCESKEEKLAPYREKGCEIAMMPKAGEHLDLAMLMKHLGEKRIDGILLEGGGTLNWSMLDGGHVNLVQAYVALKLFGGAQAPSPVGGVGVKHPDDAFLLGNPTITRVGEDILIESEVL